MSEQEKMPREPQFTARVAVVYDLEQYMYSCLMYKASTMESLPTAHEIAVALLGVLHRVLKDAEDSAPSHLKLA
jgi:hypothetical protein